MIRNRYAKHTLVLLSSIFMLSSCQKSRTIDDKDAQKLIESIKVFTLQNRVDRLERNAIHDYAAFRRSDHLWAWLTTNSLSVRVKAEIIGSEKNGARVRIGVANPLAMELSDCMLKIQ